MEYPNDRRYAESHEWALESDGLVTVGISDFAQDQLGDVVFVELPSPGTSVSARDPVAVVESVKTASDIYAPVAGEIAEVNGELESRPELINEDPFGEGWLFKLKPDSASADLGDLLDADAYQKASEEES